FSPYDSVFHVAAIVHKNEKNINPQLYYTVNRDLPVELAKKAKSEGVKQFIFLSTMSVYGRNEAIITSGTSLSPDTFYGKSKLE
ncbi:NAD-dependent epimerase/dehydratase family protein, partial [Streptococcus pyogenes]